MVVSFILFPADFFMIRNLHDLTLIKICSCVDIQRHNINWNRPISELTMALSNPNLITILMDEPNHPPAMKALENFLLTNSSRAAVTRSCRVGLNTAFTKLKLQTWKAC